MRKDCGAGGGGSLDHAVDGTISQAATEGFAAWKRHDDAVSDFCDLHGKRHGVERFNHCAKGTEYVSPPGGGNRMYTSCVHTRKGTGWSVTVHSVSVLIYHSGYTLPTEEKPCLGSGTLFNFLLKRG